MGICNAQAEIESCLIKKYNYEFRLMQISNSQAAAYNLYSNELDSLNCAEDIENKMIELAFESTAAYLDTTSEEYTIIYQQYLDDLNECEKRFERQREKIEREQERKDEQWAMEQEQIQTQNEANQAYMESCEKLLDSSIKDDFSYGQ